MSEKYEAIPILFKEKNSPLKRLPILAPHMKSNTVSSHPKKWYGCNFSVDWPIRGPLHTHTRKGKLLCSSLAGWVPWTTLILLSWMHMHILSFFLMEHIYIYYYHIIFICVYLYPHVVISKDSIQIKLYRINLNVLAQHTWYRCGLPQRHLAKPPAYPSVPLMNWRTVSRYWGNNRSSQYFDEEVSADVKREMYQMLVW